MNTLLSADGIAKSFGPTRVLSGVTLSVAPGEPVGLFGPNGSGKTTLVNILSGLLPPDAGTVRFDGKEITRLPLDARYRLGIARTFQIPHPYPALSVREAVRVALVQRLENTLAFERRIDALDASGYLRDATLAAFPASPARSLLTDHLGIIMYKFA